MPKLSLLSLTKEVRAQADEVRARIAKRYFKTGKGEYGEGDIFLGLTVPLQRKIAKKYVHLGFLDLEKLIKSKIHEHRFIALIILVWQYQKADEAGKKRVADFYIKNRKGINNWDLVDTSAPLILGAYLYPRDRKILYRFAKSKDLWEKRIAILSTLYFIRQKDFHDTLEIAKTLLHDKHDLIHKAVGWMLREVGKKSRSAEEAFLREYCRDMPRTMLRYAVEKFPKDLRTKYLKG